MFMKPISVEFTAKAGEEEFKEESVGLHSPEELFAFVAPGGGCDAIPDEVTEIRMNFLSPAHLNTQNPTADCPATLQVGCVLFSGPLAEIVQTAEEIIDKAGRGELAESFRRILHLAS
jgi:hypothetical protein